MTSSKGLKGLVGSNITETNEPVEWSKQLDEFVYGDMPSGSFLYLSKSPKDIGLNEISLENDLPILMKQSVVKKIEAEHEIAVSSLKELPKLLKEHPLSFESLTAQNALVVVCNAKDVHGGDIIVALHLEKENRRIQLNEIASVYGKGNIPYLITNAIDLNKKVYTNEFTADWIRQNEVQFPERIANRLYDNYISTVEEKKQDIIKPEHLGLTILAKIAQENNWEYYSIVEDTKAFDNGLMLLAYENKNAENEFDFMCLNVEALGDGKVVFENDEVYDLDEFLKEHNIDNLGDVKVQDFIDAQGLSEEVHAPQHADASFAKPLKFAEIETPQDVRDWVEQVDSAILDLVSDRENPTQEFLEGLQQEKQLFGALDKNAECRVFNVSEDCDRVQYDDVMATLRDKFDIGIENLRCAVQVWQDMANDRNLPIDEGYVQMIQARDIDGLSEFYQQNNTVGANNEIVYEDTCVLQELVDEEYIDDINQEVNSREFEILSDGEEIPLDIEQSQAQKKLSSDKSRKKQNKGLNRHTNAYKKTEQFDESRNSREEVEKKREERVKPKRVPPSEHIAMMTARAAAHNASLEQSQSQCQNRKIS